MSKLSAYLNEMISFIVMLLMLAALISGQLYSSAMQVASAEDGRAEISHIRLEDE